MKLSISLVCFDKAIHLFPHLQDD